MDQIEQVEIQTDHGMTKVCSPDKGCGQEKDIGEFYKKSDGDGYYHICKQCDKEYKKQYRLDNKEKVKEQKKQYYLDNAEKEKERSKQYRLNNAEKEKERRKQYRLNNTEKVKELRKQYRLNNAEKLKENSKQYYLDNLEKEKERKKQYYLNNLEKMMLRSSIKRARQKGIEHNITLEDIVIPEYCPVLGIKLQRGEGGLSHNSPSLDRIDNSKGYMKGNIRVISWRANSLKNDASIEELEKVIEYMKGVCKDET